MSFCKMAISIMGVLLMQALSQSLCNCQFNETLMELPDVLTTQECNRTLEKASTLELELAQNMQKMQQFEQELDTSKQHEDQLIDVVSFQAKTLQGLLEENQVLRRELLEMRQQEDWKSAYNHSTNSEMSSETHRWEFLCGETTEVPEVLRHHHRASSSTAWLQQPALLVESVQNGAEFAACLLLLLGANPMVRHQKDRLLSPTALHWSAAHGRMKLTAALIHAGALVDARDKHNQTALHWAAGNGQLQVTRVLLDNGASRTAVTDSSWTPLHYAALKGHLEEARLLVNGAPDVPTLLAKRNDQGKTPREVALSFGWQELADWLFSQEQLEETLTTITTAA